jgi:hypothetical protein
MLSREPFRMQGANCELKGCLLDEIDAGKFVAVPCWPSTSSGQSENCGSYNDEDDSTTRAVQDTLCEGH